LDSSNQNSPVSSNQLKNIPEQTNDG